MEMLWRRRTAVFCFVFVYVGFASIFLTGTWLTGLTAGLVLLLAFTFLPSLCRPLQKQYGPRLISLVRLGLCAAVAAGCFFGMHQWLTLTHPVSLYENQTTEITAEIRTQQYSTVYAAAYTADIETANGVTLRILLTTDDASLTAGDRIAATVTFSAFPEYNGSFPERRYYASMCIPLRAEAVSVTFVGQTEFSIIGWFSDLRDFLSGMLRADLGRKDSALTAALFLGERSELADTLNRDFHRLGISHLLAISGMHFTILLSGLDRLLRPFIPGKKKRALLLAAAAVGYMLLCGLTESVVRAGLMLLLTYAAMFFGRKSDLPTSLGISAMLILLFSPASVYSVGLQLSVTAVLALCAFDHITRHLRNDTPISKKRQLARQAAKELLLPVAVQIVLMPLFCLYFGEMSLLTPVATVLFTPLTELLLLLTPCYLLLRVVPPAALVLGAAIKGVSQMTEMLASALASLRGISLSLAYPFTPLWAAVLSAAVLTAPLKKNRKALRQHLSGALGLFILFFALLFCAQLFTADQIHIHSVSRGKNDAVILMTAGDVMLLDISDGSYGALSTAYAAAADAGAVELEALYLTHLHNRHVQSVDRLSDTVYVRSLLLPSPETDEETKVYTSLCSIMERKQIPVYVYTPNDVIGWGNNVEIFPAARTYLSRSTHPVIALTVRANGTVFSYLGTAAEEIAAFTDQSSADILVLGAHGPIRKMDVALSLSPSLHTVILRSEEPQSLPGLPPDTTVYKGKRTVSFRLKP